MLSWNPKPLLFFYVFAIDRKNSPTPSINHVISVPTNFHEIEASMVIYIALSNTSWDLPHVPAMDRCSLD